MTVLPGRAGRQVGRGWGHGAGVSGFWWGWQASVRRSCAQNSELRLPPLPMWLRQPGRGRRVAGTAALCGQSEAGVALGALPPLGPTLRGAGGGGQQWLGDSAAMTTAKDCVLLADSLVSAFLAQIGQRAGVCPHLNQQEPSQRKGQLRGAPRLLGLRRQRELEAGAESSTRVCPNLGFGRIISGAYSRSISHQVALSHWHTWAQRTTLLHTGTTHPGTTHLPESGTHRHRRPHTKMLFFTHTPRDAATPEHIGAGTHMWA